MMHKRHRNAKSENIKKSLLIVGNKYILEKITHGGNNKKKVLTSPKELFLLVNDSETNAVMFSCKTNLQFLSTIDVFYVEGTFKAPPKFFHQLLTIHALCNGHFVPLAFFLLANLATKQQTSY
jgi:hypothetical protein